MSAPKADPLGMVLLQGALYASSEAASQSTCSSSALHVPALCGAPRDGALVYSCVSVSTAGEAEGSAFS